MPRYGIDKNKIQRVVNAVLPKSKAVREFGLVFVSPAEMSGLNKKYRGRKGPANVLSFDTGDVVLCPSVIKVEAKEYGLPEADWMTRLIVHGILHLAGYRHDGRKDTGKMEKLEKRIWEKLISV